MVIRVPEAHVDRVLRLAKEIDTNPDRLINEAAIVAQEAREKAGQLKFFLDQPVNVASVPKLSPFRYPGGKTWLVPYVRRWLYHWSDYRGKPCRLIEPFAGGAIVSLTAGFEDLADQVVFAELDSHVSAVWKVILNGKAVWLAERIRTFEVSYETVRKILDHPPRDICEHAFQALLRNRVQRSGIMAPGAGLILTGENGRGLLSRWYPETLARRIIEINRRKARFNFQVRDGFDLIEEFAGDPSVVFFVDPPYTKSAKRLYEHWHVDHERLFQLIAEVAGNFLMTYDDADEIRTLAKRFKLEARAIAMKNGHNAKMTELLIGRDLSWLPAYPSGVDRASHDNSASFDALT